MENNIGLFLKLRHTNLAAHYVRDYFLLDTSILTLLVSTDLLCIAPTDLKTLKSKQCGASFCYLRHCWS